MESGRFDRLTRQFLAVCDRRALLGAIVFGAAGRVAIAPSAGATMRGCRRANAACTRASQCCSGRCATDPTLPRRKRNRCFTCTPACDGKHCGDDGCGGTCGACQPHLTCQDDGTCGVPCISGTCANDEVCLNANVCALFPDQVDCAGDVCIENICANVPAPGEAILLNDGSVFPGRNPGTYNVPCQTNADCEPVCGIVEGERCVCGHTFCYDNSVLLHFSPICVANDSLI